MSKSNILDILLFVMWVLAFIGHVNIGDEVYTIMLAVFTVCLIIRGFIIFGLDDIF